MPTPPRNSFFAHLRPALLGLLLLGCYGAALARPRPPYALPAPEKPVALLQAGRATFLVTEHSVFRLEGRELVRKTQVTNTIQCAALADTALWLGTQKGAFRLNTATFRPRPVALPGADAAASITALFRDAQGAIWVGANGYGVFRQAHGAFVQELKTPAINGGAATADSAVWIATSIGLSQRRHEHADWTRYNEEGVANHEIPDNIVEKVLPDNAGNLWVVMSDAICVFENGGRHAEAEAELPTVKFLGRPGNELFGVAWLPTLGRLFATADGLLLLPNEPAAPFSSFAPSTDKIEPKRLLVPLPGAGKPVLLQVDRRQRLWLAGAEGLTVLTANELRQLAQQAQAAGSNGVAHN